MVILLTHRQLAFLGTLFKEDPPLGFYIALVFMPKTHQPSVIGRRSSPTFGEYCTASQAQPPGAAWPPGCRRRLQIGLASMTLASVTHVKALRGPASALLPASGHGTSWCRAFPIRMGAPCPCNGVMGGIPQLRSLLILLARGSAGLHCPLSQLRVAGRLS